MTARGLWAGLPSPLRTSLFAMGLVLLLGVASLGHARGAAPAAAIAPPMPMPALWQAPVAAAAASHGLDAELLHAVIQAESRFNPTVVSASGAVGLMQLMPRTAAFIGKLRGNVRQQLLNPLTNLDIGTRYLSGLVQDFQGQLHLALAAYNAGSGSVRKAGNQIPANRETQTFVAQVLATYHALLQQRGPAPRAESMPDASREPSATAREAAPSDAPPQPVFHPAANTTSTSAAKPAATSAANMSPDSAADQAVFSAPDNAANTAVSDSLSNTVFNTAPLTSAHTAAPAPTPARVNPTQAAASPQTPSQAGQLAPFAQ